MDFEEWARNKPAPGASVDEMALWHFHNHNTWVPYLPGDKMREVGKVFFGTDDLELVRARLQAEADRLWEIECKRVEFLQRSWALQAEKASRDLDEQWRLQDYARSNLAARRIIRRLGYDETIPQEYIEHLLSEPFEMGVLDGRGSIKLPESLGPS